MKGRPFGVNKNFSPKRYNAEKKPKMGPFGVFNMSVAKHQKIEEGTLWGIFFEKNVSQCRGAVSELKGGPFSLSRYCMLRGKRGKTFLVQTARPNDSIWDHKVFKNYFGYFAWIEKIVTIKKSHYNSRISLDEAPTKMSHSTGDLRSFLLLRKHEFVKRNFAYSVKTSDLVQNFEPPPLPL